MFNNHDVKDIFSGKIANSWEEKSKYISKVIGEDNKIIFFIKKYIKPNMDILEIGCGTGKLLQQIDNLSTNLNLTGIELSNDMLNNAKKKIFNNNISFINSAIEDFLPNKQYDLIIMKQVLHHLSSKEKIFKKLSEFLKTNGKLIIMTPNDKYQMNIIKFKSINDSLGRISDSMIYNYISNLPLIVLSIQHVNSIAKFCSLYEYFMFLYSIGSLQKIYDYKYNYIFVLKFIYMFKNILKKQIPILVNFNYSYIIITKIME